MKQHFSYIDAITNKSNRLTLFKINFEQFVSYDIIFIAKVQEFQL